MGPPFSISRSLCFSYEFFRNFYPYKIGATARRMKKKPSGELFRNLGGV